MKCQPSSILSTSPTKSLVLGISNQTYMLDKMFPELLSYPKGLYNNKSIYPCVYADRVYLSNKKKEVKGKDLSLSELYNNKSRIYDTNNKLVIDTTKKNKYSNKPILPYVGMHLLAIWVIHLINSYSTIKEEDNKKGYICYDRIYELYSEIAEEVDDEQLNIVINDIDNLLSIDRYVDENMYTDYSNVLKVIRDFIGDDTLHLYSVDLEKSCIIVNKYVDYRIYEWSLMKEATNDTKTKEGGDS